MRVYIVDKMCSTKRICAVFPFDTFIEYLKLLLCVYVYSVNSLSLSKDVKHFCHPFPTDFEWI